MDLTAFNTSSDSSRFDIVETPIAWLANKIALIDKLLSGVTSIVLLNGLILLNILGMIPLPFSINDEPPGILEINPH